MFVGLGEFSGEFREDPHCGGVERGEAATALRDNGVEPRKAASLLGRKVTTHLAFYATTTDAGASEAAAVAGGLFSAAPVVGAGGHAAASRERPRLRPRPQYKWGRGLSAV